MPEAKTIHTLSNTGIIRSAAAGIVSTLREARAKGVQPDPRFKDSFEAGVVADAIKSQMRMHGKWDYSQNFVLPELEVLSGLRLYVLDSVSQGKNPKEIKADFEIMLRPILLRTGIGKAAKSEGEESLQALVDHKLAQIFIFASVELPVDQKPIQTKPKSKFLGLLKR